MSYHEYAIGREIAGQDFPFYALIQAAMRKADTENLDRLRQAFPEVWAELRERYYARGGRIAADSGDASAGPRV